MTNDNMFELPCADVLAHLGFDIEDGQRGNCPWRPDSDSKSFCINGPLWVYHAGTDEEYSGNVLQLAERLTGTRELALELLRTVAAKNGTASPHVDSTERKIEATYDYEDADGSLVIQVIRWKPKGFSQRRPDPDHPGQWIWNIRGTTPPLYNLRRVMAAPHVVVVEGEKDADLLNKMGFVATTNSGGAGKWEDRYTEALRNKRVAIIPDNDEKGISHAVMVATRLHGIASMVKIVPLPHVEQKGDFSDWFWRQRNSSDPMPIADIQSAFLNLIKAAPEFEPGAPPASAPIAIALSPSDGSITIARIPPVTVPALSSITAAELSKKEFEEVQWVVEGIIPEGLVVNFGREKIGKSWMVLMICVEVCRGGMAFHKIPVKKRGVLYLALEDSERRIKDRLIKYLGSPDDLPSNLHIVTTTNDIRSINTGLLNQLTQLLDAHPDIQFVVIDTLQKVMGQSRKDGDAYMKGYDIMSPLHAFAHERKLCILLIHHERKGTAGTDTFESISGSRAVTSVCDAQIRLERARFNGYDGLLSVTGRDVPEAQFEVSFDPESCQWKLIGLADSACRSKERDEIVDIIAELGGEARPVEIVGALENRGRRKSMAAISYLLRRMLESGEVGLTGKSTYTAQRRDRDTGDTDYREMDCLKSDSLFESITTTTATPPIPLPEEPDLGPLWDDVPATTEVPAWQRSDATATEAPESPMLYQTPPTSSHGNLSETQTAATFDFRTLDADDLYPDDAAKTTQQFTTTTTTTDWLGWGDDDTIQEGKPK